MVGILRCVRTLLSRLLLFVIMVICFIPFCVSYLLPQGWLYDNRFVYRCVNFFYWAVLKASFLPIRYKGLENVPTGPAIFVANHQSSLDVPLLGAIVKGYPHIWLAKEELMESPILRFVIPKFSVLINMATPQQGLRSLLQTVKLLKGKSRHAMIFPEGGRFVDGEVHPFFAGFVTVARKTDRPVVPVYIKGVNKVYPPDTFMVNFYPITVIVGAPMVVQDGEADQNFKDRVYSWFLQVEKGGT